MKKMLLLCILVLLTACGDNTLRSNGVPINGEVDLNKEIYEEMRAELFELPRQIDVDGIYEEKIIIVPLHIEDFDKSKIDFLYEAIINGNEISRIIVRYTDEGDPILSNIKYDGDHIFIVVDTTRDDYGSPEYYQKSFKYIKYETDGYRHKYYAVNDTEYTYEEIRTSWEENDHKSGIDFYPILIFMRHDIDKYK